MRCMTIDLSTQRQCMLGKSLKHAVHSKWCLYRLRRDAVARDSKTRHIVGQGCVHRLRAERTLRTKRFQSDVADIALRLSLAQRHVRLDSK